jgi:hypothetical protein
MFHALTKNTIELQKMIPTTSIVSMQQYKTQMIKKTKTKTKTLPSKSKSMNWTSMSCNLCLELRTTL